MTEYEYEFNAGPGTNWSPCDASAADHMASLEGFEVRRRPVGAWEPYNTVAHL